MGNPMILFRLEFREILFKNHLVRPTGLELVLRVPETPINGSTGFTLPATGLEQFRFRFNEQDAHQATGVKVIRG
jgi:hypothetical protein